MQGVRLSQQSDTVLFHLVGYFYAPHKKSTVFPNVSPVIDPHFFRDSVITDEGLRTKFMCVVTKGDPPLRFHWLKNGLPFLAHGDTTVQTFEDSSIVTFKRVSSSDRGHYTCIAANMASSTNLTTQLIVNGKKIRFSVLFRPLRLVPTEA
ncbi:down syndrome cell adhesion molecule-like protein Dscam2 [Caerostris darwini]|uniref:Down syndrome cell adhesion molecule-like protein Dscam2 n=1 Tax=Caerostris darwini TaxID=1538125 RepID=A0AAV4U4I3_9ARAC|nr:down syndrome cell adhesion molecule-like protein Dscam2 [Caerostris darwini]